MIALEPGKLAYSFAELGDAAGGVSAEKIRLLVKAGDITPKYIGRKPVILADEAWRWLNSLPEEPNGRAS